MGRAELALRAPALAGAIAVAALALFVFVVRDLPGYALGPQIPWWALAAGFAATELFVVHAHVRGSAHSLSLSELPLILGLLLASPQELVVAQVVGPAVVLALTRGHSPLKLIFNLAQFGLTACLAVDHAARAGPGAARCSAVGLWLAVFAAVLVSAVTGATLVFAAIGLSEGVIPSRRMAVMMGADLLVALTNTSVGAGRRDAWSREDRRAGWLLLPPACVLLLAYRAYVSERAKHQSLEFLYGVTRSLSRGADIESELLDLLRRTRERSACRSPSWWSSRAGPARCARRSAGAVEEVMVPVDPTLAAALRGVVERRRRGAGGARRRGRAARHYLASAGSEQALIAPVPRRDAAGGRDGARRPRRRDRLVHRRGPAAVRGARQPRRAVPGVAAGELDPAPGAPGPERSGSLTGLANRTLFLRRVEASLARRRAWPRCCSSISTTSRRSTTSTATRRATRCWWRSPGGSRRRCGRATWRRGWAATSSRCCWRTSTTITASRSPGRILDLLSEPVVVDGEELWVHGSVGIATAAAGSVGLGRAAAPRRRGDVPRQGGGQEPDARVVPGDAAGGGARPGARSGRGAAARRAGRALPADRVAGGRARSWPPRRWRAGATRASACWGRLVRARRGGRLARSSRSTARCSSRPAWRRPRGRAWTGARRRGRGGRRSAARCARRDRGRVGRCSILAPSRLVLELSESVLSAAPMAEARWRRCAIGVRIAVDDFGSGRHGVESLRKRPVDILKIAQPFVDGAAVRARPGGPARWWSTSGRCSGWRSSPQGIEREDQREALSELGCEMGQGYLLGRPVELAAGDCTHRGAACGSLLRMRS